MLSLYSTAHSQRRAERGVARVKEVSCSDTDRFGTNTNTRHTHEACHPCGSRLCTVLYVPSLVRLPRSCHPSRGRGYRDNPPRCAAVEHAVMLVVEGQMASMATSRDKRISPQRYGAPSASSWRAGLDGCAERSVRTMLTQKCEIYWWICSLKAGRQVGASGRGNKRWSGYCIPGQQSPLLLCPATASRACSIAACRRAWWVALNEAALARSGGRGHARAACPRRSRPQQGLSLLREPANCAGRTRPQRPGAATVVTEEVSRGSDTFRSDGLFGICTQRVHRYVNAGYDVTTSAQLVKALQLVANGPEHNVIRGLARLNKKWHIAALQHDEGGETRSIREVDYSAEGGIACHTHSLVGAPRVIDWRALSVAQGCTRVG